MASRKRGRTAQASSSASEPQFDDHRFKTYGHEQRFGEHFFKKGVVAEKGIIIKEGELNDFYELIQRRQWETLCTYPTTSCLNLVREFYANAFIEGDDDGSRVSYVRGRKVPYDVRVISEILHFLEVFNCGYKRQLRDPLDAAAVRDFLCYPDCDWKLTPSGHPNFLEKKYFRPAPKVWTNFVQATLMPVNNTSEVIKVRALLVYAIMMRGSIDIADVISREMKNFAKSIKTSLGYPSLVLFLCPNAGVEDAIENPIQPIVPFDAYSVAEMLRENQEVSAGNPPPPPPRPNRRVSMAERMTVLERGQQNLLRNQRVLLQSHRRIDRMLQAVMSGMHLDTSFLDEMPGSMDVDFEDEADDVEDETDDVEDEDADHDDEE